MTGAHDVNLEDGGSSTPWWGRDVNTKPLSGGRPDRPGPVTDGEDERLAELRRRVVEPVVRSMLSEQELTSLSLHWGVGGRAGDVWVRVDAPGDRYEDLLLSPWWQPEPLEMDPPTSDRQIVELLVDRLQDWIAESSFAWGQLRHSSYRFPAD